MTPGAKTSCHFLSKGTVYFPFAALCFIQQGLKTTVPTKNTSRVEWQGYCLLLGAFTIYSYCFFIPISFHLKEPKALENYKVPNYAIRNKFLFLAAYHPHLKNVFFFHMSLYLTPGRFSLISVQLGYQNIAIKVRNRSYACLTPTFFSTLKKQEHTQKSATKLYSYTS